MPGPFRTGHSKLAMLLQQVLKRFVVLSFSLPLSLLKGSWMQDGSGKSTKSYRHSLHSPEMPTIVHLCEFHNLPSCMLGHSAATSCNFQIFQNDLKDFKRIRIDSNMFRNRECSWHLETSHDPVQGPLTPAPLDKRTVETGLAVEKPRMAPTKPLTRKTLAEDNTGTSDDTVDNSISQCLNFRSLNV